MPLPRRPKAVLPLSPPRRAFDEVLQDLLDKVTEEHCREVEDLRVEIRQLRSAASRYVTGLEAEAEGMEVVAEKTRPADFGEVAQASSHHLVAQKLAHMSCVQEVCDTSLGGKCGTNQPCQDETLNPTSIASVIGDHTAVQVHPVWVPPETTMVSWSSRFDRIRHLNTTQMRDSLTSNSKGKDSESSLCRFLPIRPSSKLKVLWDLIAMVALVYDMSFTPMQVFDLPDGDTSFLGILDWACLVYWTLDLPLTFLVARHSKDGTIILSFSKIACRYVKGWFFLDVTIISVDWFTVAMRFSGQDDATSGGAGLARLGKVMRVSRSMRTLRLLRVMKLRELLSFLYEFIDSEWMSLIMGTVSNLMVLLALNHIIACLWFWLGSKTSQSTTWVANYDFLHAPWWAQYSVSLWWSLTQFTPASSSILATNPEERVFSMVIIIIALVAFSSFSGGITSAMTRLRTIKSHHITQTILLNKYLKENKISRELRTRITRYVKMVQVHHQPPLDAKKVEYLNLMSGPLNVELRFECYVHVLKIHPFFHKCADFSDSAMQHFCFVAVSTSFLARQDILFHWGGESKKMYFLTSGWLFYRPKPGFREDTPRCAHMSKDNWFCENSLWTYWMHHGLMKALIEVTLVVLDVKEFHSIACAHPEVFAFARKYAYEFVELMNTPDQCRPHTWDIPWHVMYPGEYLEFQRYDDAAGVEPIEVEVVEAFKKEAELVDMEYSRHEEGLHAWVSIHTEYSAQSEQ